MWKFESSTPCEIKGKLKFDRFPSLGPMKDLDGLTWDIHSIQQIKDRKIVHAVERNRMHPYYNSTAPGAGYGYSEQTWYPYEFEVTK